VRPETFNRLSRAANPRASDVGTVVKQVRRCKVYLRRKRNSSMNARYSITLESEDLDLSIRFSLPR
jgi:hypothetical protein